MRGARPASGIYSLFIEGFWPHPVTLALNANFNPVSPLAQPIILDQRNSLTISVPSTDSNGYLKENCLLIFF